MPTPSGQPVSVATSGTQVLMGDVGSSPASLVGGMRAVDGLPESVVKSYETTSVDALNSDGSADMNAYFGFGKFDNGNLSFTMGCTESQVTTMYSVRGILKSWKVLFISGAYSLFNGAVTNVKLTATKSEELTISVTVKVSGGISYVPADSAAESIDVEGAVTKTATYAGASADLGADFASSGDAMQASIEVDAIFTGSEDETYSFVLQQSSDNATWTACGPAVAVTAVGTFKIPGIVSKRYVRVDVTIAGTTPSITYVTTLEDLLY